MSNGNRLRECREKFGYTQEQIADYLGVRQPTYNRYEKGIHDMSTSNYIKLAEHYGISTDELMGSSFYYAHIGNFDDFQGADGVSEPPRRQD